MKKRFLSVLLVLCLLLTLVPVQAAAASTARFGSCGKNVKWSLSASGVMTISGSGAMDNYSSKTKAAPWSALKDKIQSVSIKKGVTSVGSQAFLSCGRLTKVSIPQTLTTFGSSAFNSCQNLQEINLPRGIKVIGNSAFQNCKKLLRANFPSSLEQIGSYAFNGCDSLTNIAIPKSCSVYGSAFKDCKNLAMVQISSSYNKLTQNVFYGCEKLKKVTLPKTLTEIMQGAFENCASLSTITIPSSVETIGKRAFANCASLTKITLPKGLVNLPENAFFGCSSLTAVELPGNLEVISPAAFQYCSALSGIKFPASVRRICSYAFSGCTSLKSASLPADLEWLGKEAFAGCTKLATLDFPNSLEANDLGTSPFKNCGALKTINYSGSKAQWQALNIKLKTTPKLNTVENKFTIRFDVNGGSGSCPSKTLTNGEKYGALPTPTRQGYIFCGWYTTPGGSTQITASSVVRLQASQTLYASWIQAPSAKNLAYRFVNSAKDMGYTTKPYRIPFSQYEYALGKTQYAKTVYNMMGDWEGSCFGMSTSSCLFYANNNGISPSDFQRGASYPYDLRINSKNTALGLTTRDFIEIMQILWYDKDVNSEYSRNDLDELCKAVENFKKTGKNPIVINVWGPYGNSGTIGHSLIGYDIVSVNSRQSRMMVVDPNTSTQSRYITLTKNSAGKYTGWHYDFNAKTPWGTDVSGSQISYTQYQTYLNAWNNRAGGKKVKSTSNLLAVAAANAVIKDADGNQIAAVVDGMPTVFQDDVQPVLHMGITADGDSSPKTAAFFLPCGQLYTVENADGSEDFQVSLTNVDQSVSIATDAGEITLGVSDDEKINYAELPQDGPAHFEITLSSTTEDESETIQLSGITYGQPIALAKMSGQLYADLGDLKESPMLSGEGGESGQAIQLTVDGERTDTSILAGSAIEAMDGKWQAEPESPDSGLPFADIAPEDSFFEVVKYVYETGLMTGVSTDAFGPYDSITRGQLVTILHRLEGSPDAGSAAAFSDVDAQSYWARAIDWAAENAIVSGTGDGRFSPDAPITRQDLLVILRRYGAYKGYDVSLESAITPEEALSSFADRGDVSEYAVETVCWAAAKDLFPLPDETGLAPRQEANRAQTAELLARFCKEFLA